MNNKQVYNLIIIMFSGFVHQVKIKADDLDQAKGQEMLLIRVMMEIGFWRQINHTMLIRIDTEQNEPQFSQDYEHFLEQIKSMKSGY